MMGRSGRSGPMILLVDDDVDICRNVADILNDLDYEVDFAHDGCSALALVKQKPYDVALLDLRMPGMDGLSLYREIKKIRAETVAMIVTAYASGSTVEEALAAGAWQVLSKPVDFPRLLRLVDQALGQPLVLVVDDDRELCADLWQLLRDRDFRVCLAHDAADAADKLRDFSFGAVLIDMRIPGDDGERVFQLVRAVNPRARTVLITGYRAESDRLVEQVLAAGADAVCYKPFDIPGLISTLDRLTSSSE
jgi:two-component system, NtrC family, response regulator HydG